MEFIFTWNIENISYSWHRTGENIVSPAFLTGWSEDISWTLRLYPRGINNSDYVSLYLQREQDLVPISVAFNFELSCISADESKLSSCFIPESFTTFDRGGNCSFGESQFMRRHEVFVHKKSLYLPQDILTVRCRMWNDEGDGNETEHTFGRTRLAIERIVSVENICPEISTDRIFNINSKLQNRAVMSVNIVYYGDGIDVTLSSISGVNVKSSTCKLTFKDKRTNLTLCGHSSFFFKIPNSEIWRLPFSAKVPHREENDNENKFEFITELAFSMGEETSLIDKYCTERIPEFISNYVDSCYPGASKIDCPSISKELWNLYLEKALCDLELKSGTKSFFAHKFVLCARSPVFLPMLTVEMKESISRCIKIEDISTDTLETFLLFLYTDVFGDLEWETVIELYYAADKYQVERLKFLCCSYLGKNVDCGSVCDLLILADRHQDCVLKRELDDFIWKNEVEIFRSIQWKKFACEQPDMAMRTMLSKYEDKETQEHDVSFVDILSNHHEVLDDFRCHYEGQIDTDIVITTTRTSFPAHKTILFAATSTFKDMFIRTTSRDKSADTLEIEDLDDDTVSRMLLFLYTDCLEGVDWDSTVKLYHAAGFYQIQRLKFGCSCFLLKNLRVANVGDLLLLAHEKRDKKLKAAMEEYIFLYDEEVFGSDEWAAFSEGNFHLEFETMRAKYKTQ